MRIAAVLVPLLGPVLLWGGSVSVLGAQIPGAPVLQNALQGLVQFANSTGRGIVRIIWKRFKHVFPQKLLTLGHGSPQICVTSRNNF